jgi:leucyl/phenylalanyl-tRNA---protein transferase
MPIPEFPPVEYADEHGLLAVGGDLSVESLALAYRSGVFPWPHEGYPLMWFAPPERAILDFEDFKTPKRVRRYLKKTTFTFHVNRDFASVIDGCATSPNRKGQKGTWITREMKRAYLAFHRAGYAHCFEARNEADELVGGLYGVLIGRAFAGESMFYRESNASKFVIISLVELLRARGVAWMDIQMLTPLMAMFGAKCISREDYMERLSKAVAAETPYLPPFGRGRLPADGG